MTSYQSAQYARTPRAAFVGAKPSFRIKPQPADVTPSAWRKVVSLFASSVAHKVERRARRNVSHLRHELAEEAMDALGLWVAQRQTRAHALGIRADVTHLLLVRTVYAPRTQTPSLRFWPRSLWGAAFRACDNLQHKLGKADAQPCAFFDVFTAEETPREIEGETWTHPMHRVFSDSFAPSYGVAPIDPTAGLASVFVNARCDALRDIVSARIAGETSNRARGAGRKHLGYIEEVRAYGLAALSGETFTPKHALTFARETTDDVCERLTIRKAGRFVTHDGKGGVFGERVAKREGEIAARSTLWKKAQAFADYVGVTFNARENGFNALLG